MITELIQKYLNETQLYGMFGNHECFPADIFDFHSNYSDYLKNESANMWSGYLGEEARESMRENGYYSEIDKKHNVMMIGLNTQACDGLNFMLFNNATDPGNQL